MARRCGGWLGEWSGSPLVEQGGVEEGDDAALVLLGGCVDATRVPGVRDLPRQRRTVRRVDVRRAQHLLGGLPVLAPYDEGTGGRQAPCRVDEVGWHGLVREYDEPTGHERRRRQL